MTTRPIAAGLLLAAGAMMTLAACDRAEPLYDFDIADATPTPAMAPAPEPGPTPRAVPHAPHAPSAGGPAAHPSGVGFPAPHALAVQGFPEWIPAPPEDMDVTIHQIGGFDIPLPAAWQSVPPASTMRAAEFRIAGPEGDERGAEVAVFHFSNAQGGGGTAAANIDRYLGRIQRAPDSQPVLHFWDRDAIRLSDVYVYGTLMPSGMGVGPTESQPNSALYGFIIEGGPDGNVFFTMTGSKAAVDAALPGMRAMAELVRPTG